MSDDLGIKGPKDPLTVNVGQAHEVRYWCGKWNVTEAQLKAAVLAVGTSAAAVAKKLGK